MRYQIFKKVISIIILILFTNSCLVLKVNKDSAPLVDFGTPLIGHYRNGDIPKAVLYTVLFVTGIIGIVLFAPTPTDNGNNPGILPIDRTIADPIYYSILGATACVPIASSIDTAVTYHIVNKKIIDLNGIYWDPKGKITKYDAIIDYREKEEERLNKEYEEQRLEAYKQEIEYYRQKLLDGTITEDELVFIEKSEKLSEILKNELGYYYITREKNKTKQ
ncbi:MAG TPA: hypothetical protein PK351_09060 [Spirochaetota bacterium]|nr:hypothetical protein [Spirochaetota bacterium]